MSILSKKMMVLNVLKGIGFLLFGSFCCLAAVVLWTFPINSTSYLLGFGEKVTVTVGISSFGSNFGGRSGSGQAGTGYYERNGELVQVKLYGVKEGDVVSATLPLIKLKLLYFESLAYSYRSIALHDLVVGLIGSVVMTGVAIIITLGGIAMIREVVVGRL